MRTWLTLAGARLSPRLAKRPSDPHQGTAMTTTAPRTDGSVTPLGRALQLPCGVTLPNRLAKAAMSEQLADRHNQVSDHFVRLYETWGGSGCGLLITGNMMVSRDAISEPRQVVISPDSDRAALRSLASAARRG